MLISLSKELKERNLNNPELRKVLMEKLKSHRIQPKTPSQQSKRILRHFIWGLDWGRISPDSLKPNMVNKPVHK